MADGSSVYDPNRLPWLSDDRPAKARGDWRLVAAWGVVAMLLVAGASYWLGMRSATVEDSTEYVTAPLPEAAPAETIEREPAPLAVPDPAAPEARREASTQVKPKPVVSRTVAPAAAKPAAAEPTEQEATVEPAAPPKPVKLEPWPAYESTGAAGRMVRIGTFKTSHQAKRAWWKIVRTYPGMQNLKAVTVPIRSERNGKIFYRLQFGTTSQAHSAVLCQRMRIIALSCVTVDLPGSPGGTVVE